MTLLDPVLGRRELRQQEHRVFGHGQPGARVERAHGDPANEVAGPPDDDWNAVFKV